MKPRAARPASPASRPTAPAVDLATVQAHSPPSLEERVSAALARAGVSDPRAVVVHHLEHEARVATREDMARRLSRRDPSVAFLLQREPCGPGEVLVLRSDVGFLDLVHVALAKGPDKP